MRDPLVHPRQGLVALLGLDVERAEDRGEDFHVQRLEARGTHRDEIGRHRRAHRALLGLVVAQVNLDALLGEVRAQVDGLRGILQVKVRAVADVVEVHDLPGHRPDAW